MSHDFAQFFLFLRKLKRMKEGYVIRDQTLLHFMTVKSERLSIKPNSILKYISYDD